MGGWCYSEAYSVWTEMYCNDAFYNRIRVLLQEHAPAWYTANYPIAELVAKGSECPIAKGSAIGRPMEELQRMLHRCELPEAYHTEYSRIPAIRAWVAVVKTTLLPRQAEIEQQILTHLHLFDEQQQESQGGHVVNEQVTRLFAYGTEYRRIAAMWSENDYTHCLSTVGFPLKVCQTVPLPGGCDASQLVCDAGGPVLSGSFLREEAAVSTSDL